MTDSYVVNGISAGALVRRHIRAAITQGRMLGEVVESDEQKGFLGSHFIVKATPAWWSAIQNAIEA